MVKLMAFLLVCMCFVPVIAQGWEQDNSVFNPSGIPSLTFSQPRFGDLDGDGDQDILLGNTSRSPLFVENVGTPSVPDFAPGDDITAGISALDAEMAVCVDIDNDGDPDLVTGGYTGLHLYLNIGSATVAAFEPVPGFFTGLEVGSNPVPDLADIDDDDDPDLVVGLSESGFVRLYENTGTPANASFSQANMETLGDIGLYAYPIFCDFDNDGDQDILAGRDTHGFVFFRNTGSATAATWEQDSDDFAGLGTESYWNSPDLADLTGDNLPDLIFGTADGPLEYHIHTGTVANPTWQTNHTLFGGVLDTGGASNPVFFDFDDDGDYDMISGSNLGAVKYYRNIGNPLAPAWEEDHAYFASIDHSIYAAVAIGDVNGDGLPDAIVGDLNGGLYYHRNTGTGMVFDNSELTGVSLGEWSVPRLLDMDNDGDLDLVGGNEAGNLFYYENNGSLTDPQWVVVNGYFGGIDVGTNCVPCFGDMDNDGDTDLIAGNLTGDVRCFLREGTGWTENTTLLEGITTDQNAAPALVDLDADGDLDLVVGDYDGTFAYYRNLLQSGALFNPPRNLSVTVSDDLLLVWEAPTPGSTSPLTGYDVYHNGDYTGFTAQTQWMFPLFAPGSSHTFLVTAVYQAGVSEPASLTYTMNVYNPPVDLTFTCFADSIALQWQPPQGSTLNVSAYRVYIDNTLMGTVLDPGFTIGNPQPDHTYHVAVTAVYSDGVESVPVMVDILYVGTGEAPVLTCPLQVRPNPFNPSTTVRFSIAPGNTGTLEIFNTRGQRVMTWGGLRPGIHEVVWDGKDSRHVPVGSGVFFGRLTTRDKVQVIRMLMLK